MFVSRASSCVTVLRQVHLDSRAQDVQKSKGLLDAAPFPPGAVSPNSLSYIQTAARSLQGLLVLSLFVSFWNTLCHNLVSLPLKSW